MWAWTKKEKKELHIILLHFLLFLFNFILFVNAKMHFKIYITNIFAFPRDYSFCTNKVFWSTQQKREFHSTPEGFIKEVLYDWWMRRNGRSPPIMPVHGRVSSLLCKKQRTSHITFPPWKTQGPKIQIQITWSYNRQENKSTNPCFLMDKWTYRTENPS